MPNPDRAYRVGKLSACDDGGRLVSICAPVDAGMTTAGVVFGPGTDVGHCPRGSRPLFAIVFEWKCPGRRALVATDSVTTTAGSWCRVRLNSCPKTAAVCPREGPHHVRVWRAPTCSHVTVYVASTTVVRMIPTVLNIGP